MTLATIASKLGTDANTILQHLSNERRRVVLDILAARQPPVSLSELAAEIVERETETDDPRSEIETEVQIALHHIHLPSLADADLLDYDRKNHEVTDDTQLETVRPLLQKLADHENKILAAPGEV